jgi:hypothetical protein
MISATGVTLVIDLQQFSKIKNNNKLIDNKKKTIAKTRKLLLVPLIKIYRTEFLFSFKLIIKFRTMSLAF